MIQMTEIEARGYLASHGIRSDNMTHQECVVMSNRLANLKLAGVSIQLGSSPEGFIKNFIDLTLNKGD
jgi:hypothetical protein